MTVVCRLAVTDLRPVFCSTAISVRPHVKTLPSRSFDSVFFNFRQDRRFPIFGARLYAMVSFSMGIEKPDLFLRLDSGSSLGGAATMSCQRVWMCFEEGFEG